jgi:hypothetical protein
MWQENIIKTLRGDLFIDRVMSEMDFMQVDTCFHSLYTKEDLALVLKIIDNIN